MIKLINNSSKLLLLLYCLNAIAQNATFCPHYVPPPGANIAISNPLMETVPMPLNGSGTCEVNDPKIGKLTFNPLENDKCTAKSLQGSYNEIITSRTLDNGWCKTSTQRFCDISLRPGRRPTDSSCPKTLICGNGALDDGEECDLGFMNNNGLFGCDRECKVVENWRCTNSDDKDIATAIESMEKLYLNLCKATTNSPYTNAQLCPEKANQTSSDSEKEAYKKCNAEAYKRDLVTFMAVNIKNPIKCEACTSLLFDYTLLEDLRKNPKFDINCTTTSTP